MSVDRDRLTILFDDNGCKTLARSAVDEHDLLSTDETS